MDNCTQGWGPILSVVVIMVLDYLLSRSKTIKQNSLLELMVSLALIVASVVLSIVYLKSKRGE
jgi:hypothetical protein